MLNKCLWVVLLGADGSDGEGRGEERREGAAELQNYELRGLAGSFGVNLNSAVGQLQQAGFPIPGTA